MEFESAIFHVSITSQRDPLTTNRETSAGASSFAALRATGPLGLVNQDISRGSKFRAGTRSRLAWLPEYSVTLLSVLLIICILN